MTNVNEKKVELSGNDLAEWEEFQAAKAAKAEDERKEAALATYRDMVNKELEVQVPKLMSLSKQLHDTKMEVLKGFQTLIEMKAEVLGHKRKGQLSHTFTHEDKTKRIVVGCHTNDAYLDTVDDGIAIVEEYLQSLAGDETSQELVNMVFKLLARDNSGTLKASRVLQLRQLAEKTEDKRFMEGVKLIEDAYSPIVSKQYVQVAVKLEGESWSNVPLGMTEA